MVGGRLFSGLQRLRRLLPVLASALALGGCHIGKSVSFFDDEEAVATAISAIQSSVDGPLRVFKVSMDDDEFIIQAQDPRNRSRLQEWRTTREQFAFVNWDRTSGPRAIDPVLINPKLEENLFELKDINLSGWGKIADAAIARAALEDKAGVSRIEIARPPFILPNPGSGAIRWSVEIRSPRETARIYANAAGAIIGADLNGTIRMKNLNMYQRPELAVDAAAAVRAQAGNSPILVKVSFSSNSIGFETTLKDDNFPIKLSGSLKANAVYNWSLGGLQRTMGSMDTRGHFSNPDAPFAVDEVDWALLPKIVEDARGKLAMRSGRVTSIDLTKPTDGVGMPAPLWKIDIEENRERGTYVADTKGVVKKVLLPESRRQQIDWLNPGTVADTLARIGQEFGPNAKFQQIMFYDKHVSIGAQDPRKPGEVMEVLLRDDGFSRFGTVMFPGRRQNDFALGDIKLSKDALAALLERTLAEMKMPAGSIQRITIGRNNVEASRKNNITVEIRAEARGVGSGWAVYELDGAVIRVMRP